LESLDGEWIKLPLQIMLDVGPAVQTLGGLVRLTNHKTFSSAKEIAKKARLPISTARKHLVALDQGGWIENKGRQRTRRGRPRRTATIAISAKTKAHLEPYDILPWWACCEIRKIGKLPWSAKALLAVVMARLMSLKAGAQRQGDHYDDEEVIGAIENIGGEDRFRFSLDWLAEQTGLARHSVIAAKRRLYELGIVEWCGGDRDDGGTRADLLVPGWCFRVIVTPASAGKCRLDFDAKGGGCKSG
jgi:hypothetical protein